MTKKLPPAKAAARTYSLGEAADELGVSAKTLARRIKKHGIQSSIDSKDKRSRRISDAELQRLAHITRRTLRGAPPASTAEQLAEEVRMLKEIIRIMAGDIDRQGSVQRLLQVINESADPPAPTAAMHRPTYSVVTDIVDAAIKLVETAPALLFPHENEIVVTFLGETDLFDLAPDSRRRSWRRALHEASRQGWRIVHLIRQTPDLERTMRVVEGLIHMLGISAHLYHPLYYPAPDGTDMRSDFIIVPNHGALELTRHGRYIDAAHLHEVGARYHELYQQVRELRKKSKPLVTQYHPLSVAFSRAITQVDAHESDRYLVLNGLSDLMVPGWIHEQRARFLKAKYPDDVEIGRKVTGITENRRDRAHNFTRLVQHHLVRDICPKAAIQAYVRTGEYAPDDWFRKMGCDPLPPQQVRVHLNYLIDRLSRCDKYQLGLIDDRSQVERSEYRTFWLVKSGHAVLLECEAMAAAGTSDEIDLQISEEEVVRGFFKHAEDLWRDLGRANTEKREVIHFLEAQRDLLPGDGAGADDDVSGHFDP